MYQQNTTPATPKERIRTANLDSQEIFGPLMEGCAGTTIEYFLDRELEIMEKSLPAEEPGLIRRGIYAPQLARYFDRFGRENLLVLFSNDLSNVPEGVTNQTFEFVGLPPPAEQDYPKKHVRDYGAGSVAKEVIRQRAGVLFSQNKIDLKEKF